MNAGNNKKGSAAFAADLLRTKLAVPASVGDVFVCIALGALGLWFVIEAVDLPAGRTMIGVGTFPMIVGGLLTALCVLQIGLSLRNYKTGGAIEFGRPLAVPVGMALLLLFPFSMDSVGYFQTAAIWVPVFAWTTGIRELPTIIALTLIILGLAFFLFQMVLGTPLP